MTRVQGKVAFITGAARGQGRSHAVRLAAEGADIIAVDVCAPLEGMPYPGATEQDLEETAALVEAAGRRVIARPADVRDVEALAAVVAEGVETLGGVDIVSANAGIGLEPSLAHEMPESVWQNMLDVNLTGVWHTAKAVVPQMIAAERGGSIVFTSSCAGMQGAPNIGHYVAAKHGVVGLMKTMALELARHRIRVNAILPTQVPTPMLLNEGMFRLFRPDLPAPTEEDLIPASQSRHALPVPWVESEDVSNALLFLASEEARYITGVSLPVDTGSLVA